MKRLLDSPCTPMPKQAKLETGSFFDELMGHDVMHRIVHQILQICPFQACTLTCTSNKISQFLLSHPCLQRIFAERDMLRSMWNLQPKGFDEGSLAYAEMLLQMGLKEKSTAIELESPIYKKFFNYKLLKQKIILGKDNENIKHDINPIDSIKINYIYQMKLYPHNVGIYFINTLNGQKSQNIVNIVWKLIIKINPKLAFDIFEMAVTDAKRNIPLFLSDQLDEKLIEQNWKKSFELCSQLDKKNEKKEYIYSFMKIMVTSLQDFCSLYEQINVPPIDFLLLLFESPNPIKFTKLINFLLKFTLKNLY